MPASTINPARSVKLYRNIEPLTEEVLAKDRANRERMAITSKKAPKIALKKGIAAVHAIAQNKGIKNGASCRNHKSVATAQPLLLEVIIKRQLQEDIEAYEYDKGICQDSLRDVQKNLRPEEMRAYQMRLLDLGHAIRHSKHRIEQLNYEIENVISTPAAGLGKESPHLDTTIAPFCAMPNLCTLAPVAVKRPGTWNYVNSNKRHKATTGDTTCEAVPVKTPVCEALLGHDKKASSIDHANVDTGSTEDEAETSTRMADASRSSCDKNPGDTGCGSESTDVDQSSDESLDFESDDELQRTLRTGNNVVQRCGYWECRLCTSEKYLKSKVRLPIQPCKWPLKDIAKMISHFAQQHTEHSPEERCYELGLAFDRNRGPLEYWFTKTHSMDLRNGDLVKDTIATLLAGNFPECIRKLNAASANFPKPPSKS